MNFKPTDHQRISEAIALAESSTSGEIFCIVTDRRDRYPEVALTYAAVAAFGLPLLLALLGWQPSLVLRPSDAWSAVSRPPEQPLLAYAFWQLLVFSVVALALYLTSLGRWLTPFSIKRDRVHRIAMEQFLSKGIHVTRERTGVLIFASLSDHVAEIVADEGIYSLVQPEVWGDALSLMARDLRAGRPADAFVSAVTMVGDVLAKHFPPRSANPNELPDRLIEL